MPGGAFSSGAEGLTTNQRMEITAVLEALQSLVGAVEVASDSTYVVNCFRQGWWRGWEARGWRNARGAPVANQDLWKPLIELVHARGDGEVGFRWVKGHSADAMNAFVDSLAVEAARSQLGRSGRSGRGGGGA